MNIQMRPIVYSLLVLIALIFIGTAVMHSQPGPAATRVGDDQLLDKVSQFTSFRMITQAGTQYYRAGANIVIDDVAKTISATVPPSAALPTAISRVTTIGATPDSQRVFTYTDVVVSTFPVSVFRNGIKNQAPGDFTISGGTVTTALTVTYPLSVLQTGDIIEIAYFK